MYIHYILSVILIIVGLFGVIYQNNLIKKIINLNIAQTGLIITYIIYGYDINTYDLPIKHLAPFYINNIIKIEKYVDPIPQALMLTAIVVGFAINSLAISLIIRLQKSYLTIESNEIDIKISNQNN